MTELRTTGGSAADPVEALPIAVPANVNVRITTSGGAVLLKVARAGQPALRIQTPRFALEPANNARLIIDGTGVAGGPGIEVAAGSANTTIQNVTVQGTRDHAIQVAAGQVQLGPGVLATRAGVDNERRSGLHITGGSVQITGAAQRPAIFEANTGAGISVLQAGGLEVDGTVVNGQLDGTVVVRRNAAQGAQPAGIYIEQNAAANAVILEGLVVFGHANTAGIKVRGGSKLKLRGSLVLNNGTGILLSGIAGNQDFSGVDLGRAGDGGRNVLQSAVAAVRNDAGGSASPTWRPRPPIAPISAQLNVFGGASCAVADGGKVLRFDANCMGGIDVQIPAVPAGVQVDTTLCPPPAAPAPPAIGVPF